MYNATDGVLTMMFGASSDWPPLSVDSPFVDVLTPEQYVRLYSDDPESILGTELIPPYFGSEDFGKILVRRKFPTFNLASCP